MSKLDSLIRLHERTLDEARRELGRAEAAVASAAAAIDALEAEIKAEQAAAGADLTGQFGYANYARQAIARRAELHTAHQQADALDGDALDGHRLGQPSLVDHRETIAKLEQFVEILADDDDAGAPGRKIDHRLADEAGSARIDPPGRLGDHEDGRILHDLPTHD